MTDLTATAGLRRGLMYCSVLHAALMARDVVAEPPASWMALLDKARTHNAQTGVRSVLMQRKRVVVHWLEGEATALQSAWTRIESDPNHACVVPLFDGALDVPTEWVGDALAHVGAERDEILDVVRGMQLERGRSDGRVTGLQPQGISTLLVLLDTSLHFAFTHTLKAHP